MFVLVADDSILLKVVARLSEAIAREQLGSGPDLYQVRGYDVRILFETIKRYGGRRDWTPTEANIAELPGPVRRYVVHQWREIERLQRELLKRAERERELEQQVQAARRPPR